MRNTCLAALVALGLAVPAPAQEPAGVRLYCTSIRLLPGTSGPGLGQTLQVSTTLAEVNNELAPTLDVPVYFRLEDPVFPEGIVGQIAVEMPPPVDANGNGFDDFFESSQPVAPSTTQGVFSTPVDRGTVTARWSRAAGSATGTCRLQMTSETYGPLPEFTHPFELLEYTGSLTYTPTTNLVSGDLLLTRTGSPSETLAGSFNLVPGATNRYNQLRLLAGTLTNALAQTLPFEEGEIDRDELLQTNYFGYVFFPDGEPGTATPDYQVWVISIDDPNDTDADGVPDLSDDPASSTSGLRLGLARSGDGLLLSLSGPIGRTYDLQEAEALTGSWTSRASITLTNSPQSMALPRPGTATRFWRARAP